MSQIQNSDAIDQYVWLPLDAPTPIDTTLAYIHNIDCGEISPSSQASSDFSPCTPTSPFNSFPSSQVFGSNFRTPLNFPYSSSIDPPHANFNHFSIGSVDTTQSSLEQKHYSGEEFFQFRSQNHFYTNTISPELVSVKDISASTYLPLQFSIQNQDSDIQLPIQVQGYHPSPQITGQPNIEKQHFEGLQENQQHLEHQQRQLAQQHSNFLEFQQKDRFLLLEQPLLSNGLIPQPPFPLEIEQYPMQLQSKTKNQRKQAQMNYKEAYTFDMDSTMQNAPSLTQDLGFTISQPSQALVKVNNGKRSRKALSLHGKLEILESLRQNPFISVQELSRETGVPRGTIYGIIENREGIMELAKRQPEMCRVVVNRLQILEFLLVDWNRSLESRRITVSDKEIRAQAFEISRMLSGLLREELPPCQFTQGWLKGYKQRHALNFVAVSKIQEPEESGEIESMLNKLGGFSKNDIYMCDITNMYLDMIPVTPCGKSDHHKPSQRTGSSMRQKSDAIEILSYDRVVLDTDSNNITSGVMWSWLRWFDKAVDRKVALLVDQNMWELFELEECLGKTLLRFVKLICVPRHAASYLPMKARITRDFKVAYYTLLLKHHQEWLQYSKDQQESSSTSQYSKERRPEETGTLRVVSPPDTIVSQLRRIPNAWRDVSTDVVTQGFEFFLKASSSLARGKKPRGNTIVERNNPSEATLKEMLSKFYPNLQNIALYYLNQGNEMGPSCFLRSRILAMRDHEDFKTCFGDKIDFGIVLFGSRKLGSGVRFENAKKKEMAHKQGESLNNYPRFTFLSQKSPRICRGESTGSLIYGLPRVKTFHQ
ncbi:hypothetical protein BGX27_002417 [Mortierella sp. AM989]|nr:hypothetical protein BGX27_002417 [Mortierella sp. AM989]